MNDERHVFHDVLFLLRVQNPSKMCLSLFIACSLER
jgi:hypothetical protein